MSQESARIGSDLILLPILFAAAYASLWTVFSLLQSLFVTSGSSGSWFLDLFTSTLWPSLYFALGYFSFQYAMGSSGKAARKVCLHLSVLPLPLYL